MNQTRIISVQAQTTSDDPETEDAAKRRDWVTPSIQLMDLRAARSSNGGNNVDVTSMTG